MKRSNVLPRFALSSLSLAVFAPNALASQLVEDNFAGKGQLAAAAIAHAATLTNVDASKLKVRAEADLSLPFSGRIARDYKIENTETGNGISLTFDNMGAPVDRAKLVADEQKAKAGRVGSLSQALAEKLETLRPDDTLEIAVWVSGFEHEPFDPGDKSENEERRAGFESWLADRKQRIPAISLRC